MHFQLLIIEMQSVHAHLDGLMTAIPDAAQEIKRRQSNSRLRAHVEDFLGYDIPEYFAQGPILYLARDAATPNFEILRFIELTKPYELPVVIGQDTHSTFTADNILECALGIMPIVTKVSDDRHVITEDVQIIDVAEAEGKQLKHIKTLFGADFVTFHNELLKMVYPQRVQLYSNGEWIDRHHRGDHAEYYKKVLALALVHGVFFEFYEPCDERFAADIFAKAFEFVEKEFGTRPLVCHLVQPSFEKDRTCEAYPSIIYRAVKNQLEQTA
jgi:hypothetical protein